MRVGLLDKQSLSNQTSKPKAAVPDVVLHFIFSRLLPVRGTWIWRKQVLSVQFYEHCGSQANDTSTSIEEEVIEPALTSFRLMVWLHSSQTWFSMVHKASGIMNTLLSIDSFLDGNLFYRHNPEIPQDCNLSQVWNVCRWPRKCSDISAGGPGVEYEAHIFAQQFCFCMTLQNKHEKPWPMISNSPGRKPKTLNYDQQRFSVAVKKYFY